MCERHVLVKEKVTFAKVAKALSMINVCSYIREEYEQFVWRTVHRQTFLPIATHSVGGRWWTLEEGASPAFFEEVGMNGGWLLLLEEEVKEVTLESATSGSVLHAVKTGWGEWEVTLSVPLENGEPYQGAYWRSFDKI